MKRKRYSDQQIIQILKEAEAGIAIAELSRQHGFSQSPGPQNPIYFQ